MNNSRNILREKINKWHQDNGVLNYLLPNINDICLSYLDVNEYRNYSCEWMVLLLKINDQRVKYKLLDYLLWAERTNCPSINAINAKNKQYKISHYQYLIINWKWADSNLTPVNISVYEFIKRFIDCQKNKGLSS